ncbi:MAG: hypothetical protein JKY37_28425, partial [Nannocystaceae bacterium]|nr:hypothetical protein [Nannocystaceae bacterium]
MTIARKTATVGGALLAASSLFVFEACQNGPFDNVTCPAHCWQSTLDATDIPDDPSNEGYFVSFCSSPNGASIDAPIPLASNGYSGGFAARACYDKFDLLNNSETHFLLKAAVSADMASESLTTAQQQAYDA